MEATSPESIPLALGQEDGCRSWADIESMPGVMAYGPARDAAITAVRALALRVAAGCIDHGEEAPLSSRGFSPSHAPLAIGRIGWTVASQSGSHRRLKRAGWSNYTFAFHDKRGG
jgi:hypothetical protein